MTNYFFFKDLQPLFLLFLKFLKLTKSINHYYISKSTVVFVNEVLNNEINFRNMSPCDLMYYYIGTYKACWDFIEKDYILSQLWRFYLLQNVDKLDFIDDEKRKNFVGSVKYIIAINGKHNSVVLMHFFEKYEIHS